MGIKLINEVMDHAPASLTWRERCLLDVIAEDFNEKTRCGYPSYEGDGEHSEKYRRRSHCSRSQFYEVLKALVDKGVVARVRRGNNGRAAMYKLLHLAPSSVRETGTLQGDAEPLPEGYPEPFPNGSDNPHGGLTEEKLGPDLQDPTSGVGSRFDGSRVPVSRTRSPHVPSKNLSPQRTSLVGDGSSGLPAGDGLRPRDSAAPEEIPDLDDAPDTDRTLAADELERQRRKILAMDQATLDESLRNLATNLPEFHQRAQEHASRRGLAYDPVAFTRELLWFAVQEHLSQKIGAAA